MLLYTAKEPPKTFISLFRQIKVRRYNQTELPDDAQETLLDAAKHKGAMQAMVDAEQNGWMNGYDWVLRINPDVIIKNDTWLRATMNNPEVDGIFTDCYSRNCNRFCMNNLYHSDFFAFRPHTIPFPSFSETKGVNTEKHLTTIFRKFIAKKGRDRWLQGSKQRGQCRVIHRDIIHDHAYSQNCAPNTSKILPYEENSSEHFRYL